jgi:hypothetical protein
MRTVSVVACCAAAALLQIGPVQACGDKLSVIGGGVSFERLGGLDAPGTVIMLLEPNSTLRAANDNLKLRQVLEDAGYSVRTVEHPGALTNSSDKGRVDVVLVSWGDAASVEAAFANRDAAPTVLPVAYDVDAAALTAANGKGTCYVVAAKGHDKEFVKGVTRAMKSRAKNQPLHCPAATVASAN